MKDEYSKDSLIVFILISSASAINYLSQILMSRTMSLESFGIINTIFSFILVASVPGTTFNILAAKYIAEDPRNNRVAAVVSVMLRFVLVTSAVYLITSLILRSLISRVLGSDNYYIILSTMLVVCIGFLLPIYSGAISGMKKFMVVGLISLLMPIFKTIGVMGTAFTENDDSKIVLVLLLMLVGYAVAAFIGQFYLKKNGVRFRLEKGVGNLKYNLGTVGIMTLFCNLMFIFFYNFDLLTINTLFGTMVSGLYSSAMLFGRIIFYFVTALVTVMLPFVASEKAKNGSPEAFLKKTLLYTAILTVLFFLPLNVAPKFFLSLIYGEKYSGAAKFIPYASFFSILISLLNIAINYLIGIGRLKSLLVTLFVGLVSGLLIVFFWHDNFEQVLLCISANLAVLVFISIRYCFYSDKKGAG